MGVDERSRRTVGLEVFRNRGRFLVVVGWYTSGTEICESHDMISGLGLIRTGWNTTGEQANRRTVSQLQGGVVWPDMTVPSSHGDGWCIGG